MNNTAVDSDNGGPFSNFNNVKRHYEDVIVLGGIFLFSIISVYSYKHLLQRKMYRTPCVKKRGLSNAQFRYNINLNSELCIR